MKSFSKVTMAALLGLTVLSTTVYADVTKGQKLYAKKLKSVCGVSGAKFAASHSQMEWETAKDEGTLTDLFIGACPAGEEVIRGDKFQKKFINHIYDFVYEYANDSGNVPAC